MVRFSSRRLGLQRHLHVAFDGTAPALGLLVVKLDNGDGLQHGSGYTACPTLACPARAVPRTISFGVTMSTNRSGNDDDEEQDGNDAGNTI